MQRAASAPQSGLRILLGNAGMEYRGGTQAWIHQMFRVLSENHDVHLFSNDGEHDGLPAYDPAASYDVALINHWPVAKALRSARIGKRIFTSHGTIPHEEIPILGADAYVAVSEAVQRLNPFKSTVIRNPIDPETFHSRRPLPVRPARVAFVSNRQGRARPLLEEACSIAGLELRVVGGEARVDNPEEVYEWADIVVGIARVAMEALMASRNVLCLDYQGFHGMVTSGRLETLQASNFGGHTPGTWPSASQIADALFGEYDPARDLRDYFVAHQSPEAIAHQYLDLAHKTPRSRLAALIRSGPSQLMSPKIVQGLRKVKRAVATKSGSQRK